MNLNKSIKLIDCGIDRVLFLTTFKRYCMVGYYFKFQSDDTA